MMTNEQINQAMAEILGIRYRVELGRVLTMAKNGHGIEEGFYPAARDADAVWLLERFCDDNGMGPELHRNAMTGVIQWECQLWLIMAGGVDGEAVSIGRGTFKRAICDAIMGAENSQSDNQA